MYEKRFSAWSSWDDRHNQERLSCPGVYAIAHTTERLAGRRFSWRGDIIYIGMTNSVAGLKGRLNQFHRTMVGDPAHGGADRVRFSHPNYATFRKRAYLTVAPFACDPRSNLPSDLRIMGDVARFEYQCLAHFAEQFDRLPQFNDKRRAPKFSKMQRSARPVRRAT